MSKAYSVVQLFDFLVSDLNNFYVRKLVSVANGSPPSYLLRKTFSEEVLSKFLVEKITDDFYQVTNSESNTVYIVDILFVCALALVVKVVQFANINRRFQTPLKKICKWIYHQLLKKEKKMLFIANGKVNVTDEWFASLHLDDVTEVRIETIQPQHCGTNKLTDATQELHLEYNSAPRMMERKL